jgi:hypothetical protein
MIVIGLDVHKHSLTAVAVDDAGRKLVAMTAADGRALLAWAESLAGERLWALEDCRQLTRPLERQLLAIGERLVRVPPKLMAPERRAGRARGKSDPIDALAVARAALREQRLDHPRPGERRLDELKLLVDHRDDLVDERRRAQQRLRWLLHDLDPELLIPPGALDRTIWLSRLQRRLARLERTVQVRIARELLGRCRSLTRTIVALDRELEAKASELAPGLLARPPLWRAQRCEAAQRDRPDRPLRKRRPARPPRRRRTTRGQVRQAPTPPARPRRQPATELRAPSNRRHPRPRLPTGSRLPRTQEGRGQEPPRGTALPQTPTRPRRLQRPPRRASIDIGGTLAQPRPAAAQPRPEARWEGFSERPEPRSDEPSFRIEVKAILPAASSASTRRSILGVDR